MPKFLTSPQLPVRSASALGENRIRSGTGQQGALQRLQIGTTRLAQPRRTYWGYGSIRSAIEGLESEPSSAPAQTRAVRGGNPTERRQD